MQDRHYPATGLDGLIEAIEQLFISKFDINIHAESEHVKSICGSCIEENVVQFLQHYNYVKEDQEKPSADQDNTSKIVIQ